MKRYIALLRGINISGKNKVPMAELKKGFETLAFVEVKTYLNSGNVIFSSDEDNIRKLTDKIEEMIKNQFGLVIPVFVLSKKDRERFSIKFNENDPAHDAVIRLLEKQGLRSKAQFLVNAVLHYINCPETPDIAIPQTVDRVAIEEIVAEILSQKENVRQTEDKTEIKSETIWKQGAFKPEKKPDGEYPPKEMDQATRALIADTMSAFRSN
ncbi:DUF1697 domain-containing protein [Candidatus Merdisoma sp. JLR.KK011]|uniref:DUF1697 domain-containing protein n=1 Tax=Candidatus Merdisoma sp. JLR.KK011 TaxID=3114299 RepID=UPI002FF37217